jgi:hypothetical protein
VTSVFHVAACSWILLVRRRIGCLSGPSEADSSGRVALKNVGQLTELFYESSESTLGASGHDSPGPENCRGGNVADLP